MPENFLHNDNRSTSKMLANFKMTALDKAMHFKLQCEANENDTYNCFHLESDLNRLDLVDLVLPSFFLLFFSVFSAALSSSSNS